MSEKVYPVASSSHVYYASDLQKLNKSLLKNKTLITNSALKVSAKSSPDMTVSVSSGDAFNLGMMYQNSTSVSLTIASNSESYPRKDAICVYFNGASTKLVVVQGTASSSPTIAATATDSNHILLAEVLVGVGTKSIQSSNITDKRTSSGQYILESLDTSIHVLEDKVKILEDGKSILYYDFTQTDNFIRKSYLSEYRETGFKIQNISFYLSPTYLSSCKVGGKNLSIVTLPFYYGMGEIYSININLSASQTALISGKFTGGITFTNPVSNGFNVYIPNNNDGVHDCTLYVTIYGK